MRLQDIHAEIVSTMKQVYTVFKNDGPEVRICLNESTILKKRDIAVSREDEPGSGTRVRVASFCP